MQKKTTYRGSILTGVDYVLFLVSIGDATKTFLAAFGKIHPN